MIASISWSLNSTVFLNKYENKIWKKGKYKSYPTLLVVYYFLKCEGSMPDFYSWVQHILSLGRRVWILKKLEKNAIRI